MLSLVSSNTALAYPELVNQSQYQDTLQDLNLRRNKSESSEVMFPIIVSHLDTHSMGPRVGNDLLLVSWTTFGFGWDSHLIGALPGLASLSYLLLSSSYNYHFMSRVSDQ